MVARELERRCGETGADALAFESIVAFGENAAEPHHEPDHRALGEGDVIKLDFGALVGGLPRGHDPHGRVRVGPRPSSARSTTSSGQAQQAGIDAVRAGVTGARAVDAAAAGDRGGGLRATPSCHGLGHGVGLEIHEGPSARARARTSSPVGRRRHGRARDLPPRARAASGSRTWWRSADDWVRASSGSPTREPDRAARGASQ